MEILLFKYRIDNTLMEFINTIASCPSDRLDGYINRAEMLQLNQCRLYLVAAMHEEVVDEVKYDKFCVIVAKSHEDALEYFNYVTGDKNGTIVSELKDSCAGLHIAEY